MSQLTSEPSAEMTLAEHAEAWWREQGKIVPAADTPEWDSMYEQWIEFAFAEFGNDARRN